MKCIWMKKQFLFSPREPTMNTKDMIEWYRPQHYRLNMISFEKLCISAFAYHCTFRYLSSKGSFKKIENVNITRLKFLSFYQVNIEDDVQIVYEYRYIFPLSKNIRGSYFHIFLSKNCCHIYSLVPKLIRQQQVQII